MIEGIGGNSNVYGANVVQQPKTEGNRINNSLKKTLGCVKEVDSFDFNKPMSESMIRSCGLFGKAVYSGSLNANNCQLTQRYDGLITRIISGNIGDKQINLTESKNSYKGEYNGNTFELKLSKGGLFGGTRYITGTMNGEEFEIDLKNSKVPENKDTQDIIAAVLLLNGEAVNTKGDNLVGTINSNWFNQERSVDDAVCSMYIMSKNGWL